MVVIVPLLRAVRLHGVAAALDREERDAIEDLHHAADLRAKRRVVRVPRRPVLRDGPAEALDPPFSY